MKTQRVSEPISFAVAAIIAIGTGALAVRFPRAPEAHSGPGSFPIFLGAVLAGLSVWGMILALRESCSPSSRSHPEAGPPIATTTGTQTRGSPRLTMLMLAGTTALYLLLMPVLGFITATTLLCTGVLMILGYRNPVRALAAGFIAAFTLYGVFGLLMNVVLPKGWIG